MMWTGFKWLRLSSLTGSREQWNYLQAASVLGICWSVEPLSTSQNEKWSTMNTLLLMCCERPSYHTCWLMNEVVDFVFIHLSTIQGDGGKLRERERERENTEIQILLSANAHSWCPQSKHICECWSRNHFVALIATRCYLYLSFTRTCRCHKA
jgi:hypothetical protein